MSWKCEAFEAQILWKIELLESKNDGKDEEEEKAAVSEDKEVVENKAKTEEDKKDESASKA